MKTRSELFINKKDAYYFSHDANARHDPQIQAMRTIYRSEGYGWFWILIELLRNEKDYKLQLTGKYFYKVLAKEFETDEQKAGEFVEDCIKEFHLFDSDGEYFWNDSLINRMKYKEKKSLQATDAANTMWAKKEKMRLHSERYANALGSHYEADADALLLKESKVKKNKENKNEIKEKGKETISRTAKPFRLASLFFKCIKSFHSTFKEPDLEIWSQGIEDIIKLDNRNVLDLELVIRDLPYLDFWRKNTLSPKELRRNFDKIFIDAGYNELDENEKRSVLHEFNCVKYLESLKWIDEEETGMQHPTIN